jgi:hypothetical protein
VLEWKLNLNFFAYFPLKIGHSGVVILTDGERERFLAAPGSLLTSSDKDKWRILCQGPRLS